MNDPEAPQELPGWLEAAQMAGLGPLEIAAMVSHADHQSLVEAFTHEVEVITGSPPDHGGIDVRPSPLDTVG